MKIYAAIIGLTLSVSALAQQPGYSAGDMAKGKSELAQDLSSYSKTKAAYAKRSKDGKAKGAYVAATVKYGTACMLSPVMDRKEKYRKALQLYREALKVDPKNQEALSNKKMIEDIYKSLGRPIPN